MRIKIFMLVTAVVLLCCSGVATAAPKTYCEELKGTDTGQACQIQMSDPAYNINISLPSYYPDQKSLENYIAQTRDKFLSAATSSTPREAPYELNITSATYQSAIPPWHRGDRLLADVRLTHGSSSPLDVPCSQCYETADRAPQPAGRACLAT